MDVVVGCCCWTCILCHGHVVSCHVNRWYGMGRCINIEPLMLLGVVCLAAVLHCMS